MPGSTPRRVHDYFDKLPLTTATSVAFGSGFTIVEVAFAMSSPAAYELLPPLRISLQLYPGTILAFSDSVTLGQTVDEDFHCPEITTSPLYAPSLRVTSVLEFPVR